MQSDDPISDHDNALLASLHRGDRLYKELNDAVKLNDRLLAENVQLRDLIKHPRCMDCDRTLGAHMRVCETCMQSTITRIRERKPT